MIYQVYVGKRSALYDFCVASVKEYCERYDIDHVVQTTPILRIKPDVFVTNRSRESYEKHGGFLPIYEKENAFDYFDQYDQIAIVDADIYIKSDAPNIFEDLPQEYDFGAVVERDMPITDQYRGKIAAYSKGQYSPLKDVDWQWNQSGAEFCNMGLMVMNKSFQKYLKGQSALEFITRLEFKDFVDGQGSWKWSTDQTLLNWFIRKEKMNIKRMDWKWNALYKGVRDEALPEAHFIHFFLRDKLPNRGENVEQLKSVVEGREFFGDSRR